MGNYILFKVKQTKKQEHGNMKPGKQKSICWQVCKLTTQYELPKPYGNSRILFLPSMHKRELELSQASTVNLISFGVPL